MFPGTVAIMDDEGVSGGEGFGLGKGSSLCCKSLDGLIRQMERPGPEEQRFGIVGVESII